MTTTSKSNSNLVQAYILAQLSLMQQKTGPIDLSIGTTIGGVVCSGYIKIKDAPALVVEKLIELSKEHNLRASISFGGLLLDFSNAKEMSREEFFK